MPEGGDHVPSDFLAIRIPDPPEPVIHRPLLMQVKTAIPAAFWMMRLGILCITLTGVRGSEVDILDEVDVWIPPEAGTSVSICCRGAKKPSTRVEDFNRLVSQTQPMAGFLLYISFQQRMSGKTTTTTTTTKGGEGVGESRIQQNDLRIRAAFKLSMSRVEGQNASR